MTRDTADALLFAFTTNRQFVVKGRNVGKTATMQYSRGMYQGAPTTITFADLQAAYDRAMKSNPNPYQAPPHRTATGPAMTTANKRSALDIVIRREILPGCVDDVAGADDFDNWVFEGFRNGVSQALGSIRARYISTNTFYRNTFVIQREAIDTALHSQANSGHMDYLIKIIDAQIMGAVRDIITNALPPHDINTCKDPECMC